ncbi:MAG: heat-inducible transcriptional repressor HrcA [Oscillospiraceae bacterium]
MPIDDRKQKVLRTIVALYELDGEPVGSGLLAEHFEMNVSSATLRNEMASLTRLGLLEQPHTSAGRVPSAKGYRYYLDNLLNASDDLTLREKRKIDTIFEELDYDPDRLIEGAATALSELTQYAVIATTPKSDSTYIAHFELFCVGRFTAALLGVTNSGGVRTRVVKLGFELSPTSCDAISSLLNSALTFRSSADISDEYLRGAASALGGKSSLVYPVLQAALKLLREAGKAKIFFEGEQNLLQNRDTAPHLGTLINICADANAVAEYFSVQGDCAQVILGEDIIENPMPGLCLVSRRYHAGSGRTGTINIAGPTRMQFMKIIPCLDYFSLLLGQCITGNTNSD